MAYAQRWPRYAHVPGRNARHAEDAFDDVRASAAAGMSAAELTACAAFRRGLDYLRSGYYWEAHEVLEPVWAALPQDSEERRFVQGLIQTANAHLKQRMGRPKAARRLCGIARRLVSPASTTIIMTVDRRDVVAMIDALDGDLEKCFVTSSADARVRQRDQGDLSDEQDH